MHVTFHRGTLEEICAWILEPLPNRYRFVVTPNAQHMVGLYTGEVVHQSYLEADLVTCDSRILELLASWCGKRLGALPGCEIVERLLQSAPPETRIAVFGPSQPQVEALQQRYPGALFEHVPSPWLPLGDAGWAAAIERLMVAKWDLLLLCVSVPKSEYIAHGLREAGRAGGTALCVGASVDFLTGEQKRAPKLWRRARTEWLFRLLTDPRRLWRRYLLQSTQVLPIFVATEILKTRAAPWRRDPT